MELPTQKEPTTPVLPTRKPSSKPRVGTGGLGAGAATVPIQDLSGDKLIHTAPRVAFNDVTVPSLGGIPLLAKLG